jgi:RsiW-degrading membrane proteinase PrsW (M82 family)
MNELQVTVDGRSYTFPPGQTVFIGRWPGNSIVVGDPAVSRRHAQLTWGPDGWRFENLGQARAFQQGHEVGPLIVREPIELSLASPQGPVLRLRPLEAAGSPPGPGVGHHAGVAGEITGVADEVVLAFEILVPVKAWLRDSGWRQGLRLLVIAYALLPLVFLALFSSSSSLAVPGFAYSLYVAPLWVIAFWLLVRPGRIAALEIYVGIGIIIWVTIWLYAVTVNINDQLVHAVLSGNFLAALAVGYNEEITKALPILLAALMLLKFRGTRLSVRMWMFLGTISGLTFGILEERLYTEMAIAQVATANAVSVADAGVLDFAFRVFVDGFEHAVWAGVSAFFVGIAVNYPRRRWQLILLGVSIVAVLHGLNDWSLSISNSYWPGILIQAVSLLLFIGYTMSASSIERQIRRTPLFRGDSMVMDAYPEPRKPAAPDQ